MANDLFDKNYAKAVSDVFNEQMSLKGKSLYDLEKYTHVKYNTLYRYFNGSRQIPIDLFQQICQYLELDFVETFRRVNNIAVEYTVNDVNNNS